MLYTYAYNTEAYPDSAVSPYPGAALYIAIRPPTQARRTLQLSLHTR